MANGTSTRHGEPLHWLRETLAALGAAPTDDCVEWPFGPSRRIYINGRNRQVSALVLELTVGPAPAGMEACHQAVICHNPRCVNPAHLRWDTHQNNMRDKLLDGTMPLGPKLTERDAWEIRELHATGEWTLSQLADEFGVTAPTIGNVINGKTWRHLEGVPRPSERDHPPQNLDDHRIVRAR